MLATGQRTHYHNIWSRNIFPFSMENCMLYLPLWQEDMQGTTLLSYDSYHYSCPVTGAVWGSQGRAMDGDDFIAVGAVADFSFIQNTGIFTTCGWMKMTDHTADRGQTLFGNTITSADKGFQFIYDNRSAVPATKQFRVDIAKGTGGAMGITSYSANNMIADNGWHFWACSGDAANVFFSVDGADWAQGTNNIVGLSSGDSTRVANVGRSPWDTPTHHLVGTAGEAWVFNKKLTNAELQNLYLVTKWRYQ